MRTRFFRGRGGAFGKLKFYQLRTFRTTGFALEIGRFSLWKFPCRSAMWCMIPGVEEVARKNERTATPPRGGPLEQAETRNRKRRRHPARIVRKRPRAGAAAASRAGARVGTRAPARSGRAASSAPAGSRAGRGAMRRRGDFPERGGFRIHAGFAHTGGESASGSRRGREARDLRERRGKGSDEDKIETLGRGKTVAAKFCPDIKGRSQLIACLAPNRRAIVSIKGPGR